MFKPYKIHSLAKELGIASKDITEFLKDKDIDLEKKHMTVLDEDYVNLVINHFSKSSEVSSLESYIDDSKEAKKATEKPKKSLDKVIDKVKDMAKPKADAKKDTSKAKEKSSTTSKEEKKDTKPKQDVKKKKEEPNEASEKKETKKMNKDANNSKPKTKEKEVLKPTGGKGSEPVITQSAEDNTKRVDTKGVKVNLDKYNDRYEKMAGNSYKGKGQGGKQRFKGKGKGQNQKKNIPRAPETEAQKKNRLALEKARKKQLTVSIPEAITVGDLAERLKRTAGEVIKKLMGYGIMATINEVVDYETAALVAMDLGANVEKEIYVSKEEILFETEEDNEADLIERPPVVVVMGHVDHGKTSLLDAIRHADVTAGEAGGITQHIGAYQVSVHDKQITFLDTPGHAAFTSMRARGANVTDIAILVVAADDGIMPQTIEAINHAKAAEVSIIVAINKMDKPAANPDKIKQELTEYGIIPEEWGGDTICVPISAKTGEGVEQLLEMVELTAEVMELKANPNRLAQGVVIEAQLDKGRGPVATILVQNGTLRTGENVIVGASVGRVRAMQNDKGTIVTEAPPSMPVEVIGLSDVPEGGDILHVVENEKLAKSLAAERAQEAKEAVFNQYNKVTLDNLFSQIEEGEMKELPIIVKADVQGTAEAVKQSLAKLENEEVRVKVIHSGAGAINESDVMLASASGAIVIGFNVRPEPLAEKAAEEAGVDMHMYRVIYDAIEDVEKAMKGMLAPKFRDVNIGRIEVRTTYKVSKIGTIAGCFVLEGKVQRGAKIRVVREGIVITEDEIKSLKRFKDDAKEVVAGYECGIGLENFNDVKEGDIFEAFITEEYIED